MIYVYEIARTRRSKDLYERFIPRELAGQTRLPPYDLFARYCTKMATGTGKTNVMALAIAWQYFNAVIENDPAYSRTFLVIAPNIIVLERLRGDFSGGLMFQRDPVIPKEFKIYWDMQFYLRGDAERASSEGAVYLTNIQQLYERESKAKNEEPNIMTTILGSKPPAALNEEVGFLDRILTREASSVMVINDEAHHTHDPDLKWNEAIRGLNERHPVGLSAQLDFSATPRYSRGRLFEWTVSDYTLRQAILDRIVKRPVKGITDIGEIISSVPRVRYEPFIVAGVERWLEYRKALEPLGKKPLLFIMMNNTEEADSIGQYLRDKYPKEFAGDQTLVIHVKMKGKDKGNIVKRDLEKARRAAKHVDEERSPINAIVSVLMLREGWDVQNVTVIVGLRPYTSKANILPEQTIGRGLRLMFRESPTSYKERVDVIGNPGFINFIEELEKEEDYDFDTWQVGKEKLVITVIEPDPEKSEYDKALPILSPIIARASALDEEIATIDVAGLYTGTPLPIRPNENEERTFRYEGKDILTLEKLFEREYTIKTPQTSQEIVSYYAQMIAHELKLPSQFAALAPKVRDYLKCVAFGQDVDLDSPEILEAICRPQTRFETMNAFVNVLQESLVQEQVPELENPGRWLSSIAPFPWSQEAPECGKTIFNKVPCENQFEVDFARFLDNAPDVRLFSKLPTQLGFTIPYTDTRGNLRHYYPDFVVVDRNEVSYLVETKGREDIEVARKDLSAIVWAEEATRLTGQEWHYVKVLQRGFQDLAPITFAECVQLVAMQPIFPD